MTWTRVVCLLVAFGLSPQRIISPILSRGIAGSTSGQTITQSDISYVGAFRMPDSGHDLTGLDYQAVAGRMVGTTPHFFVQQRGAGVFVGPYSVFEMADPGTYANDWHVAPRATTVWNWGITADQSGIYNMYGSSLGWSWCSTAMAPGLLCTPGDFIDLKVSNFLIGGMAYHDDGTGHCCLWVTYGVGYGGYQPNWNTIGCDLIAHGNVSCFGPFRFCTGYYPPTNYPSLSPQQECGPLRSATPVELPDGTMGLSTGSTASQQNHSNKGAALFGGMAWPTSSTPIGYGSTRAGDAQFRSTDIVAPRDYVAHYSLDNFINPDGTIKNPPGLNWSESRPPSATFGQYSFEGNVTCLDIGNGTGANSNPEEFDPNKYGGIGGYTSMDGMNAPIWVHTSGKSGVIYTGAFSVGHTWYKTPSCQFFVYNDPTINAGHDHVYARNVAEAVNIAQFAGSNNDIQFAAKAAYYTDVKGQEVRVQFHNDGNSQPLTVSVTGHNIDVHLATNSSGVITSTANAVISAVSANSSANALVTMALPAECNGCTNDGTGLVEAPITNPSQCAFCISPTGYMVLAGGPEFCPMHNVDSGVTVTGPTTSNKQAALVIYSESTLENQLTSGDPDYTPSADSFIWLQDISSSVVLEPNGGLCAGCLTAVLWDPNRNYLFATTSNIDIFTQPGGSMPVFYVFHINTTLDPSPSVLGWIWSLAPKMAKILTRPLGLIPGAELFH